MFVRLQFSHIKLMLLSLSLRFPGPTQPILEERQSEALRIVQTVAGWEDNSINYASNFAVVVIACVALASSLREICLLTRPFLLGTAPSPLSQ